MTQQQQEDLIARITHKYKTIFRDEGQVNGLVAQYLADNPIEGKTDAEVNALIEAYLLAHPISGDITIPITHTDQVVQQTGLTDSEVRQSVNDEINNNLGNRLQDIVSVGNVYITNYVTLYNETAPITNNTVWKNDEAKNNIGHLSSWFVVNLFDDRFFVGQSYNSSPSYILSVDASNNLVIDYTFPSANGIKTITPDGKRAIIGTTQYDLQQNGSYTQTATGISYQNYQGYIKFNGLEVQTSHYTFQVQQDGTWANVGASVVTDSRDYYQCRYSPDASIVLQWVYSAEIVEIKELDGGGSYVAMPSIQIDTNLYRDIQKAYVTWDKQKAVLLVIRASDNKYVLLTFYKRNDASNEWDMVSVNSNQDNTISNGFLLLSNDGSKVFVRLNNDSIVYFEQTEPVVPVLDADSPDPFGDGSLIHFYKLNGDATDSVGALNGSGESGTYEAANYSDGLTTDANNVLDTGYDYTTKQTQSFAVWFKRSANGTHDSIIDGFIGSSQRSVGAIGGDTGITIGLFNGGETATTYVYPSALNDGVFHHLVISSDGSSMAIYIDGAIVNTIDITPASDVASVNAAGNPSGLSLGWSGDPAHPYPFAGSLDHLQIFNRKLTDQEVGQLYNAVYTPPVVVNSSLIDFEANTDSVGTGYTTSADFQANITLDSDHAKGSQGGRHSENTGFFVYDEIVWDGASDLTICSFIKKNPKGDNFAYPFKLMVTTSDSVYFTFNPGGFGSSEIGAYKAGSSVLSGGDASYGEYGGWVHYSIRINIAADELVFQVGATKNIFTLSTYVDTTLNNWKLELRSVSGENINYDDIRVHNEYKDDAWIASIQ